jgi:5-methylthioadenosine/S-adenosylhomocysteine deaminase
VLPFEGPPIARGAVLLDHAGRIALVGPAASVPSPPGAETIALDGAAILPGLINTHTHLELTGMDAVAPGADFPEWIRQIIARKASRTPEAVFAAARQGLRDCWAQGVTTIADTGDSGAVIRALAAEGGSGIAYHELFGPHPEQAEPQFAAWRARLEDLSRFAGGRVRLGASPHAPYSVSGPLYRLVARFAADRDLPVAVHLAESIDESLLLGSGKGGFAEAWSARGIPLPPGGLSPVAWLNQHGVLSRRTLCIHLVQADPSDLDMVAAAGAALAHCPRSNQRHGHGTAPLAAMLTRGLRVGIGTDSVASVSPLDLLAEARSAQRIADLAAEAALELMTVGAARALGLEAEIGSLAPGRWGDLVAIDLPEAVDAARLAGTVLSRGREAIRLTVLGGRTVYRRT